MFVTNRKFGVIGNLCVRQSGDEYSKKCCKWRLRYVDSHLLLRVEKLHSAWLDRECNTHFCIYFRDTPFWRFHISAFSRRGSKFFHLSHFWRATQQVLFTALWAAGMHVAITMGCHMWQHCTRCSITALLHTRCQIHHSALQEHAAFFRDKGGRDTFTNILI